MSIATDIASLRVWIGELPRLSAEWLRLHGQAIYVLDFVMIGALKRTMSLASGLDEMVGSRNMVCARAILRMHLDSVSRLRAYTYVDDPESVAMAVLGGKRLDHFKSREGQALRDGYLVERFSQDFPWASSVYKSTSGYVHFSERQFYDTLQLVDHDGPGSFQLHIGREDQKYPDDSWQEVVACFNEITVVLTGTLDSYFRRE